jgi:hypothetical protein
MIENFSERIAKVDDILAYSIEGSKSLVNVAGRNLSDGIGIYKSNTITKGRTELQFKTLSSGGGISISDDGEVLTIVSQSSPPIPQEINVPGIYNSVCISTGLLLNNHTFLNVDNLYIYITSISVMNVSRAEGNITYSLDPLIAYDGPCVNKLFTNLPFCCIKLSDITILCNRDEVVVMNLTGAIIESETDISDDLDLI